MELMIKFEQRNLLICSAKTTFWLQEQDILTIRHLWFVHIWETRLVAF